VVRQSKIDRATQVDIAHPAPFLRQPHSAPAENLTHDVGVLFPELVLLVLEFERGSRLPAYVMRRLDVGGEALVVDEIGRGRLRKFGIRGLEPSQQVEMGYPVQRSRHENSVRRQDQACARGSGSRCGTVQCNQIQLTPTVDATQPVSAE